MSESDDYRGEESRIRSIKKHWSVYKKFFAMYMKSRLIYKADFVLGFTSQLISLIFSVAFLTLLFTQVENIQGWSFNEILLLAGFSGLILNLHHIFFFAPYRLGEDYIISGRMDRYFVRPLNMLFQVFARYIADDNISKFLANIAIIVYAWNQLGLTLGPVKILYGLMAIISGVMVLGSIFVTFGTTAFWTGRSQAIFWLFFRISDFRRYPYNIFSQPIKIILITIVPIAFTSFFPTTFLLGMEQWRPWQIATLVIGPVLYFGAYQFWKFGLSRYSSTGS
ncbi:ABC transporter permease [Candidatus Nanosalina sp. VS9-1]|uniref:ABC transporter permease n=1 Tax=Candidatus Nanosalina sp. VS9-1 TaxID=3388566 RepID=UPI0039E1D10E